MNTIKKLTGPYYLTEVNNVLLVSKEVDFVNYYFDIVQDYKCTSGTKFISKVQRQKLNDIFAEEFAYGASWTSGNYDNLGQLRNMFCKFVEVEEIVEPVSADGQISELIKMVEAQTKMLQTQTSITEQINTAVIEGVISKAKDIATKDLVNEIKDMTNEFIKKEYGRLPKKVIIQRDTSVVEINEITHKNFEDILKIVEVNIPIMLVGPAGSGKNHTLEQVAKGMNLDFYFTNAVTQEFKLTGFIDASGTYQETQFYKAFKNGGLFFLDEVDASSPDALVIINAALANGYFDFPKGRIEAHPNFRVVAAANTFGTGADMVYVGRNVLDGATLDRFVVVEFDYDNEVEDAIAGDIEISEFVRQLRGIFNKNEIRHILSMRAITNIRKMTEIGLPTKTIIQTSIIKGLSIDDLNSIKNELKKLRDNKYIDCLYKMI